MTHYRMPRTTEELLQLVANNPNATDVERALAAAMTDMLPAPEAKPEKAPVQLELDFGHSTKVLNTSERWLKTL